MFIQYQNFKVSTYIVKITKTLKWKKQNTKYSSY